MYSANVDEINQAVFVLLPLKGYWRKNKGKEKKPIFM